MKSITVKEICKFTGGTLMTEGMELPLSKAEEMKVDSVIINSKEGSTGTLFVPLPGEKTDGHLYISDAYSRGTKVTLTSERIRMPHTGDMVYIGVDDTMKALQELGRAFRMNFQGTVIGVTGSVGKTTTKEMLGMALGAAAPVLRSYGNRNGQLGVPLMMLELEDKYRYAVIEMGMSLPGEMERLSRIALPQAAVVTNIGVAHIGQLHTQENIRKEKLMICDSFPEQGGLLLVNGDDALLHEIKPFLPKDKEIRLKTFGLGAACDYYADQIKTLGEYTEFIFKDWEETVSEEVIIPVIGNHNVMDAVAALAAAYELGVDITTAKKGLELYQTMPMRGRIENVHGIVLIDDTYNASPDSMRSGLDTLDGMFPSGKKIAVLGSILELGEHSVECHREVGRYAAGKKLDVLVTVGTEAEQIAKAAEEHKPEQMDIKHFATLEEAENGLLAELKAGDIIYMKASRGMKLNHLAQKIREKETLD